MLGFRIDPAERLYKITEELQKLYKVHLEHPEFGVYYSVTTMVRVFTIHVLREPFHEKVSYVSAPTARTTTSDS